MDPSIPKYRKMLQKKLSPSRYEHSLSVSYTAVCLAMRYSYPIDKAEVAGLLHDCAKSYNDEEIIEKCKKHNIPLTKSELKAPAILHAKYGARMARKHYGIEDNEILDAIACHTTGKPAMNLLEKIIFVADYIEPRRYKMDNLDSIRKLAFEDLDEALYQILKGTLDYLESKGSFIDPMTKETFDYYDKIRKEM